MRLNVYSQEITDDFRIVEKTGAEGETYTALMYLLHSSDRLHQPPEHVGDDDDRSAVTFWLPRSDHRREAFARTLESMAAVVRGAKPEQSSDVKDKAKELAGLRYDMSGSITNTQADNRGIFVSQNWQLFEEEARQILYGTYSPSVGKERVFVESKSREPWQNLHDVFEQRAIQKLITELSEEIVGVGDENVGEYMNGVYSAKQELLERLKATTLPAFEVPYLKPSENGDVLPTKEDLGHSGIDLMRLLLHMLSEEEKQKGKLGYSKEELRVLFSNNIYYCLTGTHEDRLSKLSYLTKDL